MNRYRRVEKGMLFCFLSLFFSTMTTFGGDKTGPPKISSGVAAHARAVTRLNNRLALEAYEKRNASITLWPEDVVPTITDNAALLYYQACLFVPEPNEALRYEIRPNTWPTTQIRTYLGYCLPVIEMVETASRIPRCDWAVWSEGKPTWDPLIRKLGLVREVLLLDATTLAVDGHYREALDRCLMAQRLARHLSDDPELYRFSRPHDDKALYTTRILLGMIPPDTDILTWFRGKFVTVPEPVMSFPKILRASVRVQLDAVRTNPDHLLSLKRTAIELAEGEQAKEDIRRLTDEQFRLRVRDGLSQLVDSIVKIIESEMTYEQKLSHVHEFCDEMMANDATDPIVKGFIGPRNMEGIIDRSYSSYVEQEACVNGTKAAVEVYLILAQTGKLPEKLPEYLHKDPSTGQDFGYEITDEGFVLRCQSKEFLRREIRPSLEFKVRR